MIDNLIEQLDNMIQKAALDGALTQDAVRHFHELVEANGTLTEELRDTEKERIRLVTECEKLREDLKVTRGLVKMAMEAEVAMIERELKMTTLELTAKHEAKRVEDHKEMVKLIFRNTTVRKEVMTPLRGSEGVDQYGTQMAGGYASKDIIEEEDL